MSSEYVWVYSPKPAKLNQADKISITNKVSEFIKNSSKLNKIVHRIQIKAGRLYIYYLVEKYGWEEMARRIKINCFAKDPSIKSSLVFLRRTPWARKKVEILYLKK